ncbi:hypothetical protein GPECTOR_1g372 [Gonium pectorale]|uniref:Uncharacterized protein n=1 Tax=Gonium pectorale TaxID=33097 RepID=A0A150H3L4_GONPE|nr:hypothetical protein GPECTOR_1g372 [Gonium pectorale]|eukprot:KXZ56418.1 hypothetical protein GPECTOR_1g372 [Gonium pectorale]
MGPGQRAAGLAVRGGSGVGSSICTWARITAMEAEAVVDLGEYWSEPASSFLCPGLLLKEAVDDLEWPSGPVELLLQQDPPRLVLSAAGHGSLEYDDGLLSYDQVRYTYKYRHCKAAFCNLPHPKECASISTKVSIDSQGLLKVTHMLGLEPQQGGRGPAAEHPSALLESQRLYDNAKIAVVQFLVQPAEEGAA